MITLKRIIKHVIIFVTVVFPVTFISLYSLINFVPTGYPEWVDYIIVYFVHCILFYLGWVICRHERTCYKRLS